MKKFKKLITILLIFCTVISVFTFNAYADDTSVSPLDDKPKVGDENK